MQVLRALNEIDSGAAVYHHDVENYTIYKIDGVVKYTKRNYDLVKATPGSAGYDLHADLEERIRLDPMEPYLIPTGIRLQLPIGFEAQIRSRSGLAFKQAISVLNSPGTIDSDYRGEIMVILMNHCIDEYIPINPGDRIAQLVFARVPYMVLEETTDPLSSTSRGEGGFGSTGI